MNIKKYLSFKTLIFSIIILVALFLRFYQLGSNPPSLTWDEAAWGYNAYSLGIDGKDEFGRFLPIDYLESFGDFKPPMYAYLDIIPIKAFGLNEFAVRFPSALFGVLTVILTYFLVKRIFNKSKNKEFIALVSSLFLVISPWHIMLSRAAFEANVASFFIALGIWGFLAGVQDFSTGSGHGKKWYLVISAISFVLSMYTFNTARIVSPLLVIGLSLVFRKELLKEKKNTLIAVIIGFIIFLPIFQFLLSPQAGLRFKEVNIFSDPDIVVTANQEIENDGNAIWSKLMHNRRILYTLSYANHYLDNLNPLFLFIKGDGNPKFSTQAVGQMYIIDIVLVVSGILFLIRKRQSNWWIIPLAIILGIIPAGVARETPHALRIETTLPMFQILSAYGFITIYSLLNNFKLKKISLKWHYVFFALVFTFLTFNFLYFYHDYVTHYARIYSGEWQYGYKESINYVKDVEKDYDYIQVTSSLGRPYIYYLFYTNKDPKFFREDAKVSRDVFGFVKVNGFGKYIFPEKYEYALNKTKKVLYINTPYKLPENIKVQKTFYLLNGQPILVAYTL